MTHYIYSDDYLELTGREQCLLVEIDTRHAGNGEYMTRVAPMTRDGVDMSDASWHFSSDLTAAEF